MSPVGGRVSRAERGSQLLDVALGLVANEGYRALTMARVAREAGVSKPIVYRSYPSRAALMLALLRREQRRTEAVVERALPTDPGDRHPREVLLGAAERVLDAVAESPATWRLLLLPPAGTPRGVRELVERRRRRFLRRARKLVRWSEAYLEAEESLDEGVVARVLVALVEEEARMLLADPAVGREALTRSNRAIIDSIAWRERPLPEAGLER